MSKPVLLYYCKQSHGIGGLVRAMTIAQRLANRFEVLMLGSGVLPAGMAIPPDVEFIELPPLRLDIDSNVVSIDTSESLQKQIAIRREVILTKFARHRPRVLLIENFPFGGDMLRDELLPLLESVRSGSAPSALVICSVTDIVTAGAQDREGRDDRVAGVLDKYFDAVLVHSDPVFARLEEFFQPRNARTTPVYHTGFVLREREYPLGTTPREERVLVAAGGGITGRDLFSAAVEAHRLLWDVDRLPMTIVAGPTYPADDLRLLEEVGRQLPALTVQASVPDLGAEFAKVHWAVCQCGYNTALDVIATRVAALFIPDAHTHDVAQFDRAQRLGYWGVARTLMPHHLNGASLASGVHQLMKFQPAETDFNLDGAEITANLIYDLSMSEDATRVPRLHLELPDRKRPP